MHASPPPGPRPDRATPRQRRRHASPAGWAHAGGANRRAALVLGFELARQPHAAGIADQLLSVDDQAAIVAALVDSRRRVAFGGGGSCGVGVGLELRDLLPAARDLVGEHEDEVTALAEL